MHIGRIGMQLALLKDDNTEQKFRDLYYHLYSNSSSSRSERILGDLSKLILISICHGRGEMTSEIALFTNSLRSGVPVHQVRRFFRREPVADRDGAPIGSRSEMES